MTIRARQWHIDHAEELLLGVERVCKEFHRTDLSDAMDVFPEVNDALSLSMRRVEAHLRLAEMLPDVAVVS